MHLAYFKGKILYHNYPIPGFKLQPHCLSTAKLMINSHKPSVNEGARPLNGKTRHLIKVNLVRKVLQFYVKVPRSTCGLPGFFQNFHNAVGSVFKYKRLAFAAHVGNRR